MCPTISRSLCPTFGPTYSRPFSRVPDDLETGLPPRPDPLVSSSLSDTSLKQDKSILPPPTFTVKPRLVLSPLTKSSSTEGRGQDCHGSSPSSSSASRHGGLLDSTGESSPRAPTRLPVESRGTDTVPGQKSEGLSTGLWKGILLDVPPPIP